MNEAPGQPENQGKGVPLSGFVHHFLFSPVSSENLGSSWTIFANVVML
jgi:hypothetical protein